MQFEHISTKSQSRHRIVFHPHLERLSQQQALWYPQEPFSKKQKLQHQQLHQALASVLTEKQREAVQMHFFEGLSQHEIAKRLGVSQQVIQKRIYGDLRKGKMIGGALNKLRKALKHFF